jgi:RNA polymerase sigma-70 factor (ECF subfamily)
MRIVRLEPSEPDESDHLADRDLLEHAFRRLSTEQRAVVVLHHYVGLPLTEVAATLGIPVGTARSRLHYATRTLRVAVETDAWPIPTKERLA